MADGYKRLGIHKKFNLLSKYMDEFIQTWPKKIPQFEKWADGYLAAQVKKGEGAIKKEKKNRCAYCWVQFDEEYTTRTKDHVVPTSKGGLNSPENKLPCCWNCNQWKGDKLLEEWLKEVKTVLKKERWREPYNYNIVARMVNEISRQIAELKTRNKGKVSRYRI
jgi:hypothetical protein